MAAGERARDDAGTRPPRDGGASDVLVGGASTSGLQPNLLTVREASWLGRIWELWIFENFAALSLATIITNPALRLCWMSASNCNVVLNCGVVVAASSPKLGALLIGCSEDRCDIVAIGGVVVNALIVKAGCVVCDVDAHSTMRTPR